MLKVTDDTKLLLQLKWLQQRKKCEHNRLHVNSAISELSRGLFFLAILRCLQLCLLTYLLTY